MSAMARRVTGSGHIVEMVGGIHLEGHPEDEEGAESALEESALLGKPIKSPRAHVQDQLQRSRVSFSLTRYVPELSAFSSTLRGLQVDQDTGRAMGLVALSAFVYSLKTLSVKELNADFSVCSLAFYPAVGGALVCLAAIVMDKQRTSPMLGMPENRRWLIVRGLLAGVSVVASCAAVVAMDLAVASVILSTSPFWTALLAAWYEKGSWTKYDTYAAMACTTGMLMIVKPGFGGGEGSEAGGHSGATQPTTMYGFSCALLSAVCMAGVMMATRMVKREDTSVVTLYAMLGAIVLSLPGAYYESIQHVGKRFGEDWFVDLLQLGITGMLCYTGQNLKTYALQISKSMGVVVMRYLEIFFAFMWDITVLHMSQDLTSVLGALVIVGACVSSVALKGGEKH